MGLTDSFSTSRDDSQETFPPSVATFLAVFEFQFNFDWKKEQMWICHLLVICLVYESAGDDGHGAKSPEFNHGQQAKEVRDLRVQRLRVENVLNGINKDL